MARDDKSSEMVPSQLLLREAEEHYAGALKEITALRKDIRERAEVPEAEVRRITGNYTRATQTLFDERKKLEEFGRRNRNIGPEQVIDFDAVRGEIGGLLDRLRTYGGPK